MLRRGMILAFGTKKNIEDFFLEDELPTDLELKDFAHDELVPDFIHEAIEVDVEVFDE